MKYIEVGGLELSTSVQFVEGSGGPVQDEDPLETDQHDNQELYLLLNFHVFWSFVVLSTMLLC